jgi:hypothetical protein
MKNLISNIYAVERKDEREQIKSWHAKGNRMLLWHGTRGENLIGIIQTGFRIAPSDARRTGAMFGEGVYFSDIFNKCFQYAQTANYNVFSGNVAKKAPKKYMFLCEVVLGKMKRLSQAQNVTDLPNEQFQSVMGYGRVGPNPLGNIYMSNGCVIPLGNLVSNPPLEGDNRNDGFNSLQYNEYVVYNTTQIRIRYIVELREIEEQY